jgi:hypothetical protein
VSPAVELKEKGNRDFTPDLHHAVHQLGGVPAKTRVEANGQSDGAVFAVNLKRDRMGRVQPG